MFCSITQPKSKMLIQVLRHDAFRRTYSSCQDIIYAVSDFDPQYHWWPSSSGPGHRWCISLVALRIQEPIWRSQLSKFLLVANLDTEFWPYWICLLLSSSNQERFFFSPVKGQDSSPLYQSTGKRDNFKSSSQHFGCRVWIRPPGRRRAKFKPNSRKGIFLGYVPHTTRNILWFDVGTERVKIATCVRFDEGMDDSPFESILPNVSTSSTCRWRKTTICCRNRCHVCRRISVLFVSFCRPCLEDFEEVLYGLHFWNRSCLRRSFEACVHSDCRAE